MTLIFSHVEHAMGTVFSFRMPDGVSRAELDAAVSELHRLDRRYSPFDDGSWVCAVRRGDAMLGDATGEDLEVLDGCSEMSLITQGYFDAWAGGGFDPSGWVKGWAVRKLASGLRSARGPSVLVNGGGDIQAFGRDTELTSWRLAVSHPMRPGHIAVVIEGSDELAVATSGTTERGAHILSKGGAPASDIVSISVVGPDTRVADSLATAGVAMGRHARSYFESDLCPSRYGALAFMSDGEVWWTDELAERAGLPTAHMTL